MYPEIAANLNIYSILEFRETKEQGKRGSILCLQDSQQMVWHTEIKVKFTIMKLAETPVELNVTTIRRNFVRQACSLISFRYCSTLILPIIYPPSLQPCLAEPIN